MRRPGFEIPALTPDLKFFLEHWEEMERVSEEAESGRWRYRTLSEHVERVHERASFDLKCRITRIAETLGEELDRKVWIGWTVGGIENSWGAWGYMRKSRRNAHTMGWAGVYFDAAGGDARIVLAVAPRGGMSGCRFLREHCRSQWRPLVIPQEDLEHWPDWETGPCVVYHIESLRPRMVFDDVRRRVVQASRRFFRIAMGHLVELAAS